MRLSSLLSPDATVRGAQLRRNGQAQRSRAVRWRPARDAVWALVADAVPAGGRVAVVGAGNGDDLPLTRLAARAGRVDLIDVDAGAAAGAVRREPRALRRRLSVIEADVTGGAADAIVSAAIAGVAPTRTPVPTAPVGEGGYDLVIADLLYTQLLYPALLDSGIDADRRARALDGSGPGLTAGVVARLHASIGPGGAVAHLHDVAGWWAGRAQPATIDEVLAGGPARLARWGLLEPRGCDPAPAIARLGPTARRDVLWRWPFADGVDYLVRGRLVCGGPS
jgi:hypothetical protein